MNYRVSLTYNTTRSWRIHTSYTLEISETDEDPRPLRTKDPVYCGIAYLDGVFETLKEALAKILMYLDSVPEVTICRAVSWSGETRYYLGSKNEKSRMSGSEMITVMARRSPSRVTFNKSVLEEAA